MLFAAKSSSQTPYIFRNIEIKTRMHFRLAFFVSFLRLAVRPVVAKIFRVRVLEETENDVGAVVQQLQRAGVEHLLLFGYTFGGKITEDWGIYMSLLIGARAGAS